MSNGFKAYRHTSGGCQRLSEYPIDVAGADMFNGDLVMLTAGLIVPAGTTDGNLGTFVGCMYVAANGEQKFSPYWTASPGATDIRGLVSADVGVTYKVESDNVAVPGAKVILVVAAGNPTIGSSRQTVATGSGTVITVKKALADEQGRHYAEVTFDSSLGVA